MTLFSFVNQLRFRPRTDHPRHWRGNDLVFFFWRSPPLPCVLTVIPATLPSSRLRRNQSGPRHTEKVGHGKKLCHKDLWLFKMGHGTKKVENHWSKEKGVTYLKPVINKTFRLVSPPPTTFVVVKTFDQLCQHLFRLESSDSSFMRCKQFTVAQIDFFSPLHSYGWLLKILKS